MLKYVVGKLYNMHKKMETISRDIETIFLKPNNYKNEKCGVRDKNYFDGLINRQQRKESVNLRTDRSTETETKTQRKKRKP